MKTIAQLTRTIGPTFLVGISTFYAQIIQFELEDFFAQFRSAVVADSASMALLGALATVDAFDGVQYQVHLAKTMNVFNTKMLTKLGAYIVDAGRIQLVRNEFTLELNQMCRVNSQQLESSLDTCNKYFIRYTCFDGVYIPNPVFRAFIQELEAKSSIASDVLVELNEYLTYAGLQRPLRKVYVHVDEQQSRSAALFLVVVVVGWVKRNRGQRVVDSDDQPFLAGIATWLQQINAGYVETFFIQPLCGFIRFGMTMSTT